MLCLLLKINIPEKTEKYFQNINSIKSNMYYKQVFFNKKKTYAPLLREELQTCECVNLLV